MSVVRIEDPVEEAGSWSGTFGQKGLREIQRTFRVIASSPTDGPLTIRAAGPAINSTYSQGETDTELYLTQKEAKYRGISTKGPEYWWDLTCTWTPQPGGSELNLHPFDRRTILGGHMEHFERIVERDIDGNDCTNSARQYFDPPLQADDSRPVITMTRNEAAFPYTKMITYQDAVNSDGWLGFDPGVVKIFDIKPTEKTEQVGAEGAEQELIFYEVTYEFHVNWLGWQKEPLDQGRYELSTGGGLVSIKEADGQTAVNDPVMLDGQGNARPEGPPVFLPYHVYRRVNFSALNLP